ncbi:glycosyltransferase family 4 protein [Bizionia arctica]|uniref:Glycoside hydrolase n=1 Tax=Bizionia arctica TaxID=1495645 RepID=A0A917LRA4_9FLAO|nr:glycosyltransferase family 4 protein [Bizionia arctica]GGG52971.1 glycoside hydrolase [Bizionia arctica]
MNNKNILIVTSEFPPQPGGIGNHAYYLALYLSKNDYVVSVIADQRDVLNEDEIAFDAGLPFQVRRIPLQRLRVGMYLNRISKTLKAFKKADYVIATGKFSLWNVAFCSNLFKRPTMAVIHGTEVNFKSASLKKAVDISLKRFDCIVAVSNYTKHLVSDLNKVVTVIPNGIELEQWQIGGLIKASLKGNPVLTTVGRVSTRKGQLQVIKQLPVLLKSFPELQYHCVGIPTEADDFLEQAKTLGVDSHVTFHGAVDAKTLKEVLLATDVFVMLSTESTTGDVEGFGIAILEANALGIPSIGSKNCGIEDAILNGKSGFLVSRDCVSEFEKALKSILETPDVYKKEAIAWAKKHSWDDIIKRYIKEIEA